MIAYAKYIGPTNTRGAKVKAWARNSSGKKIFCLIAWNQFDRPQDAYRGALKALCMKMGIEGHFIHGSAPMEPETFILVRSAAESGLLISNIQNIIPVFYMPCSEPKLPSFPSIPPSGVSL